MKTALVIIGLFSITLLALIGLRPYIFSHKSSRSSEGVGFTIKRKRPQFSDYESWLNKAKGEIPVFEGTVIPDVNTIRLAPWPEMGEDINGLYLRFADYQITDGRILEIPPGGSTSPQKHLFEMAVYVLSGSGYTTLQQAGNSPQRIEWRARSLVSIPLNVQYQHFNTADSALRLLAVTSFPFVMNSMKSESFIFDNPFHFLDRYAAHAHDAFLKKDDSLHSNITATNIVEDVLTAKTHKYDSRGIGNKNRRWMMAGNTMLSMHVSEMPPKMFKKAHRHSSDAFILILSGNGFSLTWREGAFNKHQRVDWQAGTLFVPPIYWYHQHLNPGNEPVRYLAINAPWLVEKLGLRFTDQLHDHLPEIESEWQKALEISPGISD